MMPAERSDTARKELLERAYRRVGYIAPEVMSQQERLIADLAIELGSAPKAPVAPDREKLAEAIAAAQDAYTGDNFGPLTDWEYGIAEALLATPGLFQSRAEVQAEALEAAAARVVELPYIRDWDGYTVDDAAYQMQCDAAAAIREGAAK